MSFVAINVLTVPPAMRDTLEQRFGARAGEVEKMDGFQHFELLHPLEGQDSYLVYTRWDSEEHFQAWVSSEAFGRGHAKASSEGPAATDSSVWTFAIAQSTTPQS